MPVPIIPVSLSAAAQKNAKSTLKNWPKYAKESSPSY